MVVLIGKGFIEQELGFYILNKFDNIGGISGIQVNFQQLRNITDK